MEIQFPNLREMRRQLKLKVREVAEATGIPKSTISDIENRVHEGSYSRIRALEEFYTKLIKERGINEA